MHKNILTVVGITILFLGLAVQPSIAVNSNSIDSEEDCDICPKVNNTHLVRLKSLINRVETINNKLSVVSKLNPIVAQKYQELSDRITANKKINKELSPDWNYPIICTILIVLLIIMVSISGIVYMVSYISPAIYSLLFFVLLIIGYPILSLSLKLDCIYWQSWWY